MSFKSDIPAPAPPTACNHTVAPDGDVVLSLKNPNAPFAVWNDRHPRWQRLFLWEKKPEPKVSEPAIPPVTFLVSSHHLKSASPVFNATLTGPWEESVPAADGRRHITTEDWDPEALLIFLNVIHCRNNQVPQNLMPEMLCKVSVLVDYYRAHEAVRFHGMVWIDQVDHLVPWRYGRDLIFWLCISWVFKKARIFEQVTKIAISGSPESVSALDLPIPAPVIRRINSKRELIFASLEAHLIQLTSNLVAGEKGCCFECQSIMLGALMKHLATKGAHVGVNGCYFPNMDIDQAIKAIEDNENLELKWKNIMHGGWHNCGFSLKEAMVDIAKRVSGDIESLELKEFIVNWG
ncbi:hypothetical protein VTH82DRAFT_2642 [Thermothelomyces myriococcoides]